MNSLSYAFITLVALACAVLLLRGYLRSRVRMLFWCALCFLGLTLANGILFVDLVVLPDVNLYPLRLMLTAGSLAVLIFGFVWEGDKHA